MESGQDVPRLLLLLLFVLHDDAFARHSVDTKTIGIIQLQLSVVVPLPRFMMFHALLPKSRKGISRCVNTTRGAHRSLVCIPYRLQTGFSVPPPPP